MLERTYSLGLPFALGTLLILAISNFLFILGAKRRMDGLHRLGRTDPGGAFESDAGRALLDLRIVVLIEAALTVATLGGFVIPPEYVVLLAELIVLTFTAALVYLTAVYASESLGANVDRLISENRSSQVSGSSAIVEALRTVKESNEAGSRLIASEISSLRGDVADAEERRRRREQELVAAATARAETERLAVRPNLDGRLDIVGGPLHNVMLSIGNSGLDAFNLTVRIDGRSPPNPAIPIGRVGRGETKLLNLGDVGVFPRDREVPVVAHCSAFDVAGRPLEYTWRFQYLRSTGLFGVTTSWKIRKVG